MRSPSLANKEHIGILDGWRAMSITFVMAGHWLPLGPKFLQLNSGVAAAGMALFFTLSGFLITWMLLKDPEVVPFLFRRLFRIIPLAWLAMAILAIASNASFQQVAANFLFFSNLPPAQLMPSGEHLWSLCVEMQFYLGVATLVLFGGRKALFLLPAIGVSVTLFRIYSDAPISIVTWHRVDEILAGATVALLWHHGILERWTRSIPAYATLLLLGLAIFAGTQNSGALMYLRPYLAASAIAVSLYQAPGWMRAMLTSATARYIAATSYALYVFHVMLQGTWLGSGETIEKYLKRPLLLAATVACAHLSTFYYEKRMIALGRTLAEGYRSRKLNTGLR